MKLRWIGRAAVVLAFAGSVVLGDWAPIARAGSRRQGDGPSLGPVVDASGLMVAFASFATNLVPGDTNGHSDVFMTAGPAFKW